MRGVDYEVSYNLAFSRFGRNDSLGFRLIASYLYDLIVDTGSGLRPIN